MYQVGTMHEHIARAAPHLNADSGAYVKNFCEVHFGLKHHDFIAPI